MFLVLVFPLYLLYMLFRLAGNTDAVFMSFSQAISLIPGKIGIYIRAAFYRLACTDTSDEISVGFLTIFSHADTTIEKGVYIGPQCNIGKCIIKKETLLGSGVHILSGKNQHGFDDINQPIQAQSGSYQKILIGTDCWLGNSTLVMANLKDKTVVAAGSVVTKPGSRGDILAGNPARAIRNRFITTNEPKQDPSWSSLQ
jgi:acetyltransferase-like isoleucine patch superfamily enzyme